MEEAGESIRFSTTRLREFGRDGQSSSQLEPVDGGSATFVDTNRKPEEEEEEEDGDRIRKCLDNNS